MKLMLQCLLLIFLHSTAHASINTHQYSQKILYTSQWQVNDVKFKATTNITNPFDRTVNAVFTGKLNQTIPLFYNGNNEWILRFSSASIGEHDYTIQSEIAEFNQLSGHFKVSPNTKKNRNGAITLNKNNPQHFYYENGKHYSSMAFELDWLFALDYPSANAQQTNTDINPLSKTNHLLDLIKNNGFNQIVTTLYSYDVSWEKDPKLKNYPEYEYGGREDIYPFLGSNSNPDHSALNVKFFQHYDQVMASMHEREIVNHLMIYVWNKMVNWPELGSKEDNRFFDYVIKRYQAFPNLIWDVSKEALHYKNTTQNYISERIQRIRQLDAFNRLVTVHDYGFCARHPDEVDFISTQDWKHTIYHKMLEVRAKFPNKPIVNIEHGGYEASPIRVFPGAYEEPEVTLRRNYMCLFAGVYQTYYWQGTSWNVIIHNPFETDASFAKPNFKYFAIMKDILSEYSFDEFEPNPNRNGTGYNLTNPKTGTVLMYVPKENYSITLGYLANGEDKYKLKWINVLTGEVSFHEPEVHKGWFNNSPWRNQADTIVVATKVKP